MSGLSSVRMFICLCACVPVSGYAVDSMCEGCINFHLCSMHKGYAWTEKTQQYDISDAVIDSIISECQYVDGMSSSGVFYDSDLRAFAEFGINAAQSIFFDYSQGASRELLAAGLAYFKRSFLDSCYAYGYCAPYNQCHDENGDKYVLVVGNDNWSTGASISCTACPGDGTFQGASAPQVGYSWGKSSCGISSDTTYSDTTGTYVYSEPCMYNLTPDDVLDNGDF